MLIGDRVAFLVAFPEVWAVWTSMSHILYQTSRPLCECSVFFVFSIGSFRNHMTSCKLDYIAFRLCTWIPWHLFWKAGLRLGCCITWRKKSLCIENPFFLMLASQGLLSPTLLYLLLAVCLCNGCSLNHSIQYLSSLTCPYLAMLEWFDGPFFILYILIGVLSFPLWLGP